MCMPACWTVYLALRFLPDWLYGPPPLAAGNGGSLEKCRRRWDLCDADFLKYKFLVAFDRAMTHLDKAFGFMSAPHQYISRKVGVWTGGGSCWLDLATCFTGTAAVRG